MTTEHKANIPTVNIILDIDPKHNHPCNCPLCDTPMDRVFEPLTAQGRKITVIAASVPSDRCPNEECGLTGIILDASVEFLGKALVTLTLAKDYSITRQLKQELD